MTYTNQFAGSTNYRGVVNIIREWLFGPKPEVEEKRCAQCELLQEQLNFANYDRKVMLEKILELTGVKPQPEVVIDASAMEPIHRARQVPWRVRQQELENKSREIRRQMEGTELPRHQAGGTVTRESIDRLERELKLNQEKENVPEQASQGSGQGG